MEELPAEMPQELKTFIANAPEDQRQQIWVSCNGQDGIDRENLGNGFEYYPPKLHGFPGYFYPYTNTPGYLSPLIAVRLMRPGSKLQSVLFKEMPFIFFDFYSTPNSQY